MSESAHHPDPPPTQVAGRLRPTARPLRRGDGQVQFGVDPDAGMVLAGLSEAETTWLLSLRSARLPPAVRSGLTRGLDPLRVAQLTDLMRAHGLVETDPGQSPAPPQTARVAVLGRGRLHAQLCSQVRRGGTIDVPTEVSREDPPDLAVLLVSDAVPTHEAQAWARSGIPHLPVVVSRGRAVAGPVVAVPGSPCLHCLDLTRSDQDPAWPHLLNQLLGQRPDTGPAPVDPALATMLVGLVDMLVQTHLDGLPVPPGVTWELALPSPMVTARRWPVHPRCPAPHAGAGQAATSLLRGRPRGRLRGTTTPAWTS